MNPKQIDNIKKYVGNQIKAARITSVPPINVQQLANILHVRKSTISQYENGKNLPSIAILLEIAKTFCMTLDQLLDLDYDTEWFKRAMNRKESDEEAKFLKEFQDTFRGINPEGKKLLLEMAIFARSRYKRNFKKELDIIEEKEEKKADLYGQLDQLELENKLLEEENEELKYKLGFYKILTKELSNSERTDFNQRGYIVITEDKRKIIEERIKKKEELINQFAEIKETPPHKPGTNFTWGDNESYEPINKKDDPTK